MKVKDISFLVCSKITANMTAAMKSEDNTFLARDIHNVDRV